MHKIFTFFNSMAKNMDTVKKYEKKMFQELSLLHSKEIKAKDAYIVQAADYIANAIYEYYEYGDKTFYNQFSSKIKHQLLFPWRVFGK